MRKYTLIILFLSGIFKLSGQTIPNSGFENWTAGKPTGWDASNEIILGNNFTTVTPDTSNVEGDSCVRIRTISKTIVTTTVTIPGLITLGDFTINLSTMSGEIDGGVPFTSRPDTLTGYFISDPEPGDSGMIVVGFAHWDSI